MDAKDVLQKMDVLDAEDVLENMDMEHASFFLVIFVGLNWPNIKLF